MRLVKWYIVSWLAIFIVLLPFCVFLYNKIGNLETSLKRSEDYRASMWRAAVPSFEVSCVEYDIEVSDAYTRTVNAGMLIDYQADEGVFLCNKLLTTHMEAKSSWLNSGDGISPPRWYRLLMFDKDGRVLNQSDVLNTMIHKQWPTPTYETP